jgi:L-alanine-DL-glutamate epimerase-like enolase superfamily enzyme
MPRTGGLELPDHSINQPLTRRQLARLLLTAPLPPVLRAWQEQTTPKITIAGLELWRYEGRYEALAGVNRQYQVNPLHIYDELRPAPYRDSPHPQKQLQSASALYLKVRTSEPGLEGLYGPIDPEAVSVIRDQLGPFLLGKDALAVEKLWDQMHRSNRHSRRGHFMIGLSAVDNALWDLRGRYWNAPVYRLLGGPTRNPVEAYASCLGFSVESEAARKTATDFKDQGFRYQKWFLPYGPGSGQTGLMHNVNLVRVLRESVGDEVDLMFDAFMGWNLDYAIAWAKRVEQFHPRWIEEAFHADKIQSFVELRRATSIPVASGEHFYGRWEAHEYLRAGAVSVVQADPEWCGGVSELVKICALASLYDAQVIPHGHSIHAALHVVASQSPMLCPLVEYLWLKMQHYYWFERQAPRLVKGRISLPEGPGFGMAIDPAKVEKQTLIVKL